VEEVVGVLAGGIEADDEVNGAVALREAFEALAELGITGGGLDEGQFVSRGLQIVAQEGSVVSVACGVDADADARGWAGRNRGRSRLRSGSVLWYHGVSKKSEV
jgi:hypothetical protein